jgi:hypothetical protein
MEYRWQTVLLWKYCALCSTVWLTAERFRSKRFDQAPPWKRLCHFKGLDYIETDLRSSPLTGGLRAALAPDPTLQAHSLTWCVRCQAPNTRLTAIYNSLSSWPKTQGPFIELAGTSIAISTSAQGLDVMYALTLQHLSLHLLAVGAQTCERDRDHARSFSRDIFLRSLVIDWWGLTARSPYIHKRWASCRQ